MTRDPIRVLVIMAPGLPRGDGPDARPHAAGLARSVVTKSGVMIGHYERGGDVELAPAGPPSTSKAEIARQERMKREGRRPGSRSASVHPRRFRADIPRGHRLVPAYRAPNRLGAAPYSERNALVKWL
jgi:hypothetical protein